MIDINPSQSRAARPCAGCLRVLLLLAGFLVAVAPLRADNPPTFVFEIDSSAVPGGFNSSFVVLDSSNNVYAVGYNGVEKFDRTGNFLSQLGSLGTNNGQFNYPGSIAVDGGNNVYVVDSGNYRVEKFDSNGNYLTQLGAYGAGNGQFYGLFGIAVDSSNDVYVADQSNNRIEKFTSNGNYLTQWGSLGAGNGQFNGPGSVAVDSSNNVYVADQSNNRIEKFDSSGNYLTQWGGYGTNNGQFSVPYGIAVDRSNNVYVADFLNRRVQKFDSSGNYLTQWGPDGTGNGQLISPMGIGVDGNGNSIYVAEIGHDRIDVFAYNTNIIPPVIVSQPTTQAVAAGMNVTLSVSVVGTAPFAYQWISNNIVVFGATNATFTLTNVNLSASGAYSVLVTNDFGSELKSNAVLIVLPAAEFMPPTFLYEIDSSGVAGGFAPRFVALDASNNVYVTDPLNYPASRVVKFTAGGAYLTQWGSYGTNNSQFEDPEGIAVDGSNNVYVADYLNSRVQKFDSSGNYLTEWGGYGATNGQFDYPQGIAVDSGNNVYVADRDNSRVEKFSSIGTYLTQWGSRGNGNVQFEYPTGIAMDSGNNVYVTDFYNDRIQKFDSSGNYLAQWGSPGTNIGQIGYPEGIAVDSSNNVYVIDQTNDRIEKFDENGNYLVQWGSLGSGAGQFSSPGGIALDTTRNLIYVADSGNSRIEVFAIDTRIIAPFVEQQPTSQTVPVGANVALNIGVIGAALSYQWSSNNVAVSGATNAAFTLTNVTLSDSASYAVLVSNGYGSVLSSNAELTVLSAADFVPPTYLFQTDSSAAPGGFAPNFVALDASNNLYVTDGRRNRVVKFTAGGAYLSQWGSSGNSNAQFYNPDGIAVDGSNNVYVADRSTSRIQKFDSNGNYQTQWGTPGSDNGRFYYPLGIAVDSSNNVYVVDPGNDRVEKFDDNGNYLAQWGSYGTNNGQFSDPTGVAVDSSNNVYVADYNRVQKFDNNGNFLTQWGSRGSGNGQFDYPAGIAVDTSNYVYVADSGNDRVEKFDCNGGYLTQWGAFGKGAGQLNAPVGIALDSTGNLIYVADNGNSRIQIFVNNAKIVPPVITNEPESQIVPAGVSVTFGVGLLGAPPFVYQWSINNVAVAGATNATFTLTNVSLSDSGATCSVQVTNGYGNASSGSAMLTVLPALVTTQPASGVSATGAALNGTAVTGPEETVVWFDWGTGTNYGNIVGTSVVPGDNGSNNISTTLNGLPGNYYHYRIDAANDFGIVYGEDQFFTVGFAPSVTTLLPTNAANGATLEAAVNPEGWDTIVYFQWETPTLTNTTPGIAIAAGTTSVNVSSFVPGLAPFPPYQYQVVASNALGTAVGNVVFGDPDQHHYFYSGSKTNITLPPGTYIITAYGAAGGNAYNPSYYGFAAPGKGAEMSAEFNFSTSITLTLLVGGAGGTVYFRRGINTNYNGGGGGGGSFVVEGAKPLVIAGGGGGGAVSSRNPLTVAGGSGSADIDGGAGGGYSLEGFNQFFGTGPTGGAGGINGGGGHGGADLGVLGHGGGGGGGFNSGGDDGNGFGGGGGGSSFNNGGGGGTFFGDDGTNNIVGSGFGGGGAGYGNLGNVSYEFGFGGGGGGYSGGGGGGGDSGYDDGYSATTTTVGGGGGGGSIIDSSAIAILAEVSGIYSPDGAGNGEIIITAVPPPSLSITTGVTFGFTNGVFGFSMTGSTGSSVVIQASTDLQTWIPLQTNVLGSGPLYFSDTQSTTNTQSFYRAQLLP